MTTALMHPALQRRAIPPEFVSGTWGNRYVPFARGDWTTFAGGHSNPEPQWHKRLVTQTGGLIVNRWDISGTQIESYIRFDAPVRYRGCVRQAHPTKTCIERGCRWGWKDTKYIYPSKNELGDTSAKRIDVHPLVREELLRLSDDDGMMHGENPIYFCLEGCFKADALAGTGRLAMSVPAVTLWRVPDEHLSPWLPILQGDRVVYVVPDSDFLREPFSKPNGEPIFINEDVRYHTSECVAELQSVHNIRARYAVPPYIRRDDALARGIDLTERKKRGIDDHIYDGGNFDRWTDVNPQGLHFYGGRAVEWARLPGLRHHREGEPRDKAFLVHLERTRDRDGMFAVNQVAGELRCGRDRVRRAWQSCQRRGLIRVWPGRPLGEGKGNKAHVFRFVLEEAQVDSAQRSGLMVSHQWRSRGSAVGRDVRGARRSPMLR